jgi:phosphoglycerate dehydrogenase-like enzyme
MKVIIGDPIPNRLKVELINIYPEVKFLFLTNKEKVSEEFVDCDVIFGTINSIPLELIYNNNNLKLIQLVQRGADGFNLEALKEKGIILSNISESHKQSITEYVFSGILFFAKSMNRVLLNQKNHIWSPLIRSGTIQNKNISILGTGKVGMEIARISKTFGMNTLGVSTKKQCLPYFNDIYTMKDIHTVLSVSDFCVVCLPLTESTRRILGRMEFQSMKSSCVLINVSRGEILDEEVLLDSLQKNKIRGAIVDTFKNEPLDVNSPFWGLENCIVTPHMAGYSGSYYEEAVMLLINNLNCLLSKSDSYLNVVNFSKGY